MTDNELGPGGDYDLPPTWRREFVEFLAGADVVIHDAMYTPAQLERHRAWGHSTYEEALAVAAEAGVRHLVLFHHEPEHGDDTMDGLLAEVRRLASRMGAVTRALLAGAFCRKSLADIPGLRSIDGSRPASVTRAEPTRNLACRTKRPAGSEPR